ncbi:hypothetical protein FDP08_02165 [Marinobacter panjinensis]|uniref:MBL fold metallo-hydrolase n=1 Tax=Marinobacter panjinensis TaxID=2576384 RepID=A0A4U6QZZ7_9GAMM|nr:hypothetical protein [Marinobacter panjinensis]TKV66974.1 hypothetical protein FDP08_02165 [Marinobacter panjinensis]
MEKVSGLFAIVIASLALSGYAYLQHPKFGAIAEVASLDRSPNYVDGRFQNLQPDPETTINEDDQKGWIDMLMGADNDKTPPGPVPTDVTDLNSLDRAEDIVVWLGHSSFLFSLPANGYLLIQC